MSLQGLWFISSLEGKFDQLNPHTFESAMLQIGEADALQILRWEMDTAPDRLTPNLMHGLDLIAKVKNS